MAKIDDKIKSLAFSCLTTKAFPDIMEAVRNATDRAAAMLTKINISGVDPAKGEIGLVVKRSGLRRIGTAVVRVTGNDGQLSVSFEPVQWLTSRPTFLFIPVGPASSVVFPVLRDFVTVLRQSLAEAEVSQ